VTALTLLAVFTAGLLGSSHCLVMCGGIATALAAAPGAGARTWRPLLYQLGRLTSYCCVGALAGALGLAAGVGMAAERWGAILRLVTALIVVLIGLNIALGSAARSPWLRLPERVGGILWRRAAPLAQTSLPQQPMLRAFSLGLLWGWLPCGLVYSTLFAAAATGSAPGGALVMLAFAFGTIPAMLGITQLAARLPRRDGAGARVFGALITACGLLTAAMPIAELTGSQPHHHHALMAPLSGELPGGAAIGGKRRPVPDTDTPAAAR
jgi:uncharacterized protein